MVQAITSEAAQAAVPPTRRSTTRPGARPASGGKRKNLAKKIAKPRPANESKANTILKLLQRRNGASIAELQKATGWQSHSVRGFLSGAVKTRLGLQLQSERTAKGVRRYLIANG
jgi:hypothetical protein